MSTSYQDFLKRLKEERLRCHWSQLEMGRVMRMSQSHYSKAEQGKSRFTYYEMQCLCESDIDSYYIFTGHRCEKKYKDFLLYCSYEELLYFLNIICLGIGYFYINANSKKWVALYKAIENIIRVINLDKKNSNIFLDLRLALGYSQQKMANITEVDVKKFREIEKGKALPDSELIWKMYDRYNIPPALLVKSKVALAKTLNGLLNLMDLESAELLVNFLKQCYVSSIKEVE